MTVMDLENVDPARSTVIDPMGVVQAKLIVGCA
jgi:hypothetical protein